MSALNAHLEQIALSCQGIESLPFPPPRIFTNALLYNDDITSLIRDTEPHERALFSVPPPPPPATVQPADPSADPKSERRKTVFAVASGEVTTGGGPAGRPAARRNTAVAAVLGGELHGKLARRSYGGTDKKTGGQKGDVDVEVLLRGAEKLCGVYALPGAAERIGSLRARWARNAGTLGYYEAKVAGQSESYASMNSKGHWMDEQDDEGAATGGEEEVLDEGMTEEDLKMEEEEMRQLDRKKRELQQRLRTMEKDLNGLLQM